MNNTPPQPTPAEMPAPPAMARFAALGLAGALLVTALPGLWLTALKSDPILLFSTLFETLTAAAAILALFAGLGRFRQAWALALLCAAGTVLVCAVFARVEIMPNHGSDPSIGPWISRFAAVRVALAAGLGGIAAFAVFTRNPRSWGAVARAVLVLLPVAGVLGWFIATGGGPLANARTSPGAESVRILILCLGGLVLVALTSIGGHLIIRAFEHGRPEVPTGNRESA
jgi:hypothetical protein